MVSQAGDNLNIFRENTPLNQHAKPQDARILSFELVLLFVILNRSENRLQSVLPGAK